MTTRASPSDVVRLREAGSRRELVLAESALVGRGGEARVYLHPHDPRSVVKVYHHPAPEHARKLEVMLAAPPADPDAAHGHVSIAWPTGRVTDALGRVAGFAMPRLDGDRLRVFELYNPKTRRRRAPLFHWGYLHRAARNLAGVMAAVHARGYVVGDVNESNVLVSDEALVSLVDCDSFQVRDPATGHVFRCGVGKPDFTPPELHDADFGAVDRTEVHDRFGLAVVLFHLLMEGTHPFTGRWTGEGEPPELAERIRRGWYPHGGDGGVPLVPARLSPPAEILAPPLRDLFHRAFAIGHGWAPARPSAAEWRDALTAAEAALVVCPANPQHRYGGHLGTCPWCERAALLRGRDAFPTPEAIARPDYLHGHRAPRPPRRAPRPAGVPAPLFRPAPLRRAQPAWTPSAQPSPFPRPIRGHTPPILPPNLNLPKRRGPRFLPVSLPARLTPRDLWVALRDSNAPALASVALAVVGASSGRFRLVAWLASVLLAAVGARAAYRAWRSTKTAVGWAPLLLTATVLLAGVLSLFDTDARPARNRAFPLVAPPLAIPLQSEIDRAGEEIGGYISSAGDEAAAGRLWLAGEALDAADSVIADFGARGLDTLYLRPRRGEIRAGRLALRSACVTSAADAGAASGRAVVEVPCPGLVPVASVLAGTSAHLARADSLRIDGDLALSVHELREAAAMLREAAREAPDSPAVRAAQEAYRTAAGRTVAACAETPERTCPSLR